MIIWDKYVRIEDENIGKPQSNIHFRISQQFPDYSEALKLLKDKFIILKIGIILVMNIKMNYIKWYI